MMPLTSEELAKLHQVVADLRAGTPYPFFRTDRHRCPDCGYLHRIKKRSAEQAREVAEGKRRVSIERGQVRLTRLHRIVAMRKQGKKLREIGEQFGISRERVREILEKNARIERAATHAEAAKPILIEPGTRLADVLDSGAWYLEQDGIHTVADVALKTDEELLRLKGFGQRALEELRIFIP